jgi:hypothetical protein
VAHRCAWLQDSEGSDTTPFPELRNLVTHVQMCSGVALQGGLSTFKLSHIFSIFSDLFLTHGKHEQFKNNALGCSNRGPVPRC